MKLSTCGRGTCTMKSQNGWQDDGGCGGQRGAHRPEHEKHREHSKGSLSSSLA